MRNSHFRLQPRPSTKAAFEGGYPTDDAAKKLMDE
jgi:hypothetical protein